MESFTFDYTINLNLIIAGIAVLVTAIVGIIGLAYFQWWRNRKGMSYEVISDTALLSTERNIRDKLEIRYEGKIVSNVRSVVVQLSNSGYKPIKKADFEGPVVFDLGKLVTILSVETIRKSPMNLGAEAQLVGNRIEIQPSLFNRGDYTTFNVLVSSLHDIRLSVDARIEEVKEIKEVSRIVAISFVDVLILVSEVMVSSVLSSPVDLKKRK